MARRSIEDTNYEQAVTHDQVDEKVQGQPQSSAREPDSGEVQVREQRVRLDQPILDPNHPLAVQIPEGIGARGDEDDPAGTVFAAGTPEEQFAAGRQSTVTTGDKPEASTVAEQGKQSKPKRGE